MVLSCRFIQFSLILISTLGILSDVSAEVPRFAYVVNSFDSSLSEFIVDSQSGQLRPNGHVPTGKFPSSVFAHPSGKFVYVAQQTAMKIVGYSVDPGNGRLTPLPGSPFDPKLVSPFWMATDPAGKFLYLAGRNSKNIGAMSINVKTGELAAINGSPYPGGYLPRAVAVAQSGKFVYMSNINDDNISGYRIDPGSGALTNLPGSPFPAGDAPQFMAMHPNGKLVFVNSWNTRSILTFDLDASSGALQRRDERMLENKVYPYGISLDASGNHLYATDFFGGVLGFNVNAESGSLTPIPGSPFEPIGELPTMTVLDPSGHFAYTTNYDSHDITTYAVDAATGALSALETTWARVGPRAMALISGEKPVEFLPQSAYVANAIDNTLTAYRVDSTSGGLKSVMTVPTGTNPRSVGVSSNGRFVYIVNTGSNSISAYQVDAVTGLLKEVPGSPFKTRNDPRSIALDYNDHYVYVVHTAEHAMSVFSTDTATGALKELTQTDAPALVFPRPAGTDPRSVVLHPQSRYNYVVDTASSKIVAYRYFGNGPVADEMDPPLTSMEVAKNPVALAVDPRGKFLYIAHGSINALGIYSINIHTGAIKPVPGSPFPAGTSPTAIAVHPGGHYVYVANADSSDITVYHTDTAQRRFAKVGQVKTGTAPVAISVEGSGRFAYVANEGSNTVSIFTIDPASGMLKEAGNIPTGAKPSALAVFTAVR